MTLRPVGRPVRFTREALTTALQAADGDAVRAAAALGITPVNFRKHCERRGVDALAVRVITQGRVVATDAVPETAYADAAVTVRAMTEACVALSLEVLALQDALAHERRITARLAAEIEARGLAQEQAA